MRTLALTLLLAGLLFGGPATAWEVGFKVGPVRVTPGMTICDTIEDATAAVLAVRGGMAPPTCGSLRGNALALVEVIGHTEFADDLYAIIRVLFLPPVNLGVQYAFTLDEMDPKI